VLYLPPDVVAYLAELKEAAQAAGMRLTKSSMVAQMVRRYRRTDATKRPGSQLDADTFRTRPGWASGRGIPEPRHPRET
jgi:hypothetical protein